MGSKKLLRACPICGYGSGEVLHTQQFSLPVENPLPKSYDVVCCEACGFVFADSSASQKEYDIYYEQLSKYEDKTTASGSGLASYDAERLTKTAQAVEKFLPNKSASILDVGAANGGLLLALRTLGFKNLTGLDPSKVCVSNMESSGLQAVLGGIFPHLPISGKFDCIVLTHVLEHLYDVLGGLENILSLLNEGGILYIEVPNAALYGKYFVVPFYYFDCEHINHFDKASLKNLFGLFGGKALEILPKEIPVSTTYKYPALGMFYQKDNSRAFTPVPNFTAKESMFKHIEQSLQKSRENLELEKLAKSQSPVMVWGAGQYAQRLLAGTSLIRCNLVGFVDNDSKKHGKKLENIEIKGVDSLKGFNGTILIASALHGQEILNEIRKIGIQNSAIII